MQSRAGGSGEHLEHDELHLVDYGLDYGSRLRYSSQVMYFKIRFLSEIGLDGQPLETISVEDKSTNRFPFPLTIIVCFISLMPRIFHTGLFQHV